jgi:seryl-tRNA synthetase
LPLLVNDAAAYGTDKLPKFADDLFRTKAERWVSIYGVRHRIIALSCLSSDEQAIRAPDRAADCDFLKLLHAAGAAVGPRPFPMP